MVVIAKRITVCSVFAALFFKVPSSLHTTQPLLTLSSTENPLVSELPFLTLTL